MSYFKMSKISNDSQSYLKKNIRLVISRIIHNYLMTMGMVPWKEPKYAGEGKFFHDVSDDSGMEMRSALGCFRKTSKRKICDMR